MTHIYIEQNTGLTEEVNSSIISKLYEVVTNNTLDSNSDLKGRLHSTKGYKKYMDWLNAAYEDLHITIDTPYIWFADPEIERILVSTTCKKNNINTEVPLSSDGVGISYTDAQECTTLNIQCSNNTTVRTFDELGQFGLVNLTGGFYQATNLTSIDLSNVVNFSFTGRFFAGCSNLAIEINMPNLTESLVGTFYGCSKITKVVDLGTCNALYDSTGYGAFTNCTSLTEVHLPTTCKIFNQNTFAGCTSLQKIYPVNQVTKVGPSSLYGPNLRIVNFENVTDFEAPFAAQGTGAQYRTTIKQLYVPKYVGSDTRAFNGYAQRGGWYHRGVLHSLVSDLVYLKDIQHFQGVCFYDSIINTLVINNTTPPIIHNTQNKTDEEMQSYGEIGSKNDFFYRATISNIYVPDSAVNTYKTTAIWSDKADIIKPLSELTKVATEEDLQEGQIALIEAYMDTESNSQTQEP